MRQFNLKHGTLVPDPVEAECAPGRTIYPGIADDRLGQPMRIAESGWARQKWEGGETVTRPEGEVTDEEIRAAKEWLWHVEAGRIGSCGE